MSPVSSATELHLFARQDDGSATASPHTAVALLGPVLLGNCLQLVFYGLLIGSFSSWLNASWSRTPPVARCIITLVFVLVTFITALNVADLFHFGTLQMRSADELLKGTVIEAVEPAIIGCIGTLVQSVLATRAAKLMPNEALKWTFLVSSGVVSTLGFVGSLGAAIWSVLYYQQPYLDSSFTPTFNQCVAIWLWSASATDIGITTAFVVLFRKRLANFNESTDNVLRRICNLAIRSAAYTVCLAVPGALLSVIFNGNSLETTDIAYAFFIPLPGVYGLSLFTTLTAPRRLTAQLRGVTTRINPATLAPRSSQRPSNIRSSSSEIEARGTILSGVNVKVEHWVQEDKGEEGEEISEMSEMEDDLHHTTSRFGTNTLTPKEYLCPS